MKDLIKRNQSPFNSLIHDYMNNDFFFPIDRLFDKILNDDPFDDFIGIEKIFGKEPFQKMAYPKSDLVEFDDKYEIHCEIPSMKKEDIKVTIENDEKEGCLYIGIIGKSRKKNDVEKEGGKYIRKEIKYSSFSRAFALPNNNVKPNEITSSYNDNILKVIIPKIKKEEPKKEETKPIEIKID
jgi:HSP20 family protein